MDKLSELGRIEEEVVNLVRKRAQKTRREALCIISKSGVKEKLFNSNTLYYTKGAEEICNDVLKWYKESQR